MPDTIENQGDQSQQAAGQEGSQQAAQQAAPQAGQQAAQATPTAEEAAAKQSADEAAAVEAESALWVKRNDEFVDGIASAFIQKGGKVADLEAVMQDVGEQGKLTEQGRKLLQDTFGPAAAAMIPAIEQKAAEHKKWITGERNAIYAHFGDEAGFNKVREWAEKNIDATVRQYLTQGLNAGGASAQLACKQIKEIMREKGATVTGDVVKANGSAQGADERLTLTKYMAEYDKLHKARDSEGIKALDARAREARTKPGWRA